MGESLVISGLGIGRIGAINPGQLPFEVWPGDVIGVDIVQFIYTGPDRNLFVGWAIKPYGNPNWNNGQHVITNPKCIANTALFVKAGVSKQEKQYLQNNELAMTMPKPGDYTSWQGIHAKITSGRFTVWTWLGDYDKFVAETGGTGNIFDEKYLIMKMDTDVVGSLHD